MTTLGEMFDDNYSVDGKSALEVALEYVDWVDTTRSEIEKSVSDNDVVSYTCYIDDWDETATISQYGYETTGCGVPEDRAVDEEYLCPAGLRRCYQHDILCFVRNKWERLLLCHTSVSDRGYPALRQR